VVSDISYDLPFKMLLNRANCGEHKHTSTYKQLPTRTSTLSSSLRSSMPFFPSIRVLLRDY